MGFRYRASVVGLVALVLLASTAFSSTALSSAQLERDGTVSVTTDDSAMLGLIDGHPASGLVEQTDAGTIAIDFERGGASGPNEDARFQFGSDTSPASNHAFRIVNRGSQARQLVVSFSMSGTDGGDPGANVEFLFTRDLGSDGAIEDTVTVSEEDAQATVPSIGPDDTVYVVVTVDTRGLTATADLTGDLSITAGP